jgi:hypothetical protein
MLLCTPQTQKGKELGEVAMNVLTMVIAGFLAAGVIIAIVSGIMLFSRNRRTKELRSRFGPEYKRVARTEGDAARGEQVLLERERRVKKLDIKPLSAQQRTEFADEWEHAQAEFVDDPTAAVVHADALVQEVMRVRGYPVEDFAQRVADISVDHPAVAQNYRLAHDIAIKHEHADVGMEKLRDAMLHYRALFADLLHDGGLQPVRQVRPDERRAA